MNALIDLFPTAQRRLAAELEEACEHIEATAGRPFSEPSLAKATNWYGARHAIASMLTLGLIERMSPPRSRPVYYVVPERYAVPLRTNGVAGTRQPERSAA